MHDALMSIILGIVEGVTEFLPVSSTGHLLVAEKLLGLDSNWEAFTVVIQLGAILAVVAIYFRKFWQVLIGLPTSAQARKFAGGVILAFLPAAVVGALLASHINAVLLNPNIALPVIAISWMAGGLLILLFERLAPPPLFTDGDNLPLKKMFQIGCCQIMALIPGISRSGATILGGELLGVGRHAATLFTFYLAVPTMLGATVFELYKKGGALSQAQSADIAIGFIVSFVVAWFVIRSFLAIVTRYGLKPFGYYRIAAALALMLYLAMH
ncbi:MAG TPA: undecaprenyl-diphosphate phosphatase [Rhizomicrobium sp.]|jgi:undecaprenyl-diphosphatase|nr:undecaprenyl-diphosphate phosphatase [Rhizomicrobium sp.]